MSLDLLIPFLILIILVIYLIYSRNKFEKEILDLYEKKFDEWKSNSELNISSEKKVCKELVGLVYKEGYNVSIELLEESLFYLRLKRQSQMLTMSYNLKASYIKLLQSHLNFTINSLFPRNLKRVLPQNPRLNFPFTPKKAFSPHLGIKERNSSSHLHQRNTENTSLENLSFK